MFVKKKKKLKKKTKRQKNNNKLTKKPQYNIFNYIIRIACTRCHRVFLFKEKLKFGEYSMTYILLSRKSDKIFENK